MFIVTEFAALIKKVCESQHKRSCSSAAIPSSAATPFMLTYIYFYSDRMADIKLGM